MTTKRNLELDFASDSKQKGFENPERKKQKIEQKENHTGHSSVSADLDFGFNEDDSSYVSSLTDHNEYPLQEEKELRSPESKKSTLTPSAPVKTSEQHEPINGQILDFDESDEGSTDDEQFYGVDNEDEIADRVRELLEEGKNVRITQNDGGSYDVFSSNPEALTNEELDELFTYSPEDWDQVFTPVPMNLFLRTPNPFDSFELTEEGMNFNAESYPSGDDESTVFGDLFSSNSIGDFSAAGLVTPPRSSSPIAIPGAPLGRGNPYLISDLYEDEVLAAQIQALEYRSPFLVGFDSEIGVALNFLGHLMGL